MTQKLLTGRSYMHFSGLIRSVVSLQSPYYGWPEFRSTDLPPNLNSWELRLGTSIRPSQPHAGLLTVLQYWLNQLRHSEKYVKKSPTGCEQNNFQRGCTVHSAGV